MHKMATYNCLKHLAPLTSSISTFACTQLSKAATSGGLVGDQLVYELLYMQPVAVISYYMLIGQLLQI